MTYNYIKNFFISLSVKMTEKVKKLLRLGLCVGACMSICHKRVCIMSALGLYAYEY